MQIAIDILSECLQDAGGLDMLEPTTLRDYVTLSLKLKDTSNTLWALGHREAKNRVTIPTTPNQPA